MSNEISVNKGESEDSEDTDDIIYEKMHSTKEKKEKILIRKCNKRASQIKFHSELLSRKFVKIERSSEDMFSRKLENIENIEVIEDNYLEKCFVYDLSDQ